MRPSRAALAIILSLLAAGAMAQPIPATRLAVLSAEDRRAPTARDIATLRTGARGSDPFTARIAVRALGRLERSALIPDIVPALRHPLPEIRAEAANAIAQAARGLAGAKASGGGSVGSILSTLAARLEIEDEAEVRAALCESIGRLPYTAAADAAKAERALRDVFEAQISVTDRLGVAKGLEALVRGTRTIRPAAPEALDALRALVGVAPDAAAAAEPTRDTRVRRLALEALIAAGGVDAAALKRAAADIDPQVRRLAMRGAANVADAGDVLETGLHDPVAMVRLEAVRAVRVSRGAGSCHASLAAAWDRDTHVSLLGIDQLSVCAAVPEAIAFLENTASDLSQLGVPRAWHRPAHALVALAAIAPDKAASALPRFSGAAEWHSRTYAARAAAEMGNVEALEKLASDREDNVVEAAIDGLAKVGGHTHDRIYIEALSRPGYQAVRAAALALRGAADAAAAIPPLAAALQRLVDEGTDNSLTVRQALAETLGSFGATPPKQKDPVVSETEVTSDDLRRLAAPIARVTIRGVGRFDLALFTSEAPLTVLRIARLAEQGYYSGLTFHRVVPNFVVQGGSPGGNEYIGAPQHMRDEVGLWPNVRGAVGISIRGRDTGDAQFYINLVDNPRFDHEYTVFGQVLNGVDVIDQILEGDVIERIDIVP